MKYSIPYELPRFSALYSIIHLKWYDFSNIIGETMSIKVLGIYSEKSYMFTQNLYKNVHCFICNSPNWKQPKSPSTGERLNTQWYIYTTD